MSQRKNACFNASIDEELLALLQEQIELGKRGNRSFKQDVYAIIATKMNASNHGVGHIIASTIINHCKVLKKDFAQATELLNASGFGFDVATKRVIAEDDVWTAWLQVLVVVDMAGERVLVVVMLATKKLCMVTTMYYIHINSLSFPTNFISSTKTTLSHLSLLMTRPHFMKLSSFLNRIHRHNNLMGTMEVVAM